MGRALAMSKAKGSKKLFDVEHDFSSQIYVATDDSGRRATNDTKSNTRLFRRVLKKADNSTTGHVNDITEAHVYRRVFHHDDIDCLLKFCERTQNSRNVQDGGSSSSKTHLTRKYAKDNGIVVPFAASAGYDPGTFETFVCSPPNCCYHDDAHDDVHFPSRFHHIKNLKLITSPNRQRITRARTIKEANLDGLAPLRGRALDIIRDFENRIFESFPESLRAQLELGFVQFMQTEAGASVNAHVDGANDGDVVCVVALESSAVVMVEEQRFVLHPGDFYIFQAVRQKHGVTPISEDGKRTVMTMRFFVSGKDSKGQVSHDFPVDQVPYPEVF
jgi:hypothetical protein